MNDKPDNFIRLVCGTLPNHYPAPDGRERVVYLLDCGHTMVRAIKKDGTLQKGVYCFSCSSGDVSRVVRNTKRTTWNNRGRIIDRYGREIENRPASLPGG